MDLLTGDDGNQGGEWNTDLSGGTVNEKESGVGSAQVRVSSKIECSRSLCARLGFEYVFVQCGYECFIVL
jgi:hypothetical protein